MNKLKDMAKSALLCGAFFLGLGYAAYKYVEKIAKDSGKFGK